LVIESDTARLVIDGLERDGHEFERVYLGSDPVKHTVLPVRGTGDAHVGRIGIVGSLIERGAISDAVRSKRSRHVQ